MVLTTKIQYKNFEAGEFIEERQRTFDEVTVLAENFPWELQREHIKIGLTAPSITVQDDDNNFLKLALYYNGKFVLHYYNNSKQLFTKSFTQFRDSFPHIQAFYENKLDLTVFRLENTWMQNNVGSFLSQDFRYEINKKTIRSYLIWTSGMEFLITFILSVVLLFSYKKQTLASSIFFVVFLFVFGGGLNLLMFYNYYRYAKNKILIMSKGNDIFYYGDINNPEKFDKSNIWELVICKPRGSRTPLLNFAVTIIRFKNGANLYVPNIFVNEAAMKDKLFEYPQRRLEVQFPTIKAAKYEVE